MPEETSRLGGLGAVSPESGASSSISSNAAKSLVRGNSVVTLNQIYRHHNSIPVRNRLLNTAKSLQQPSIDVQDADLSQFSCLQPQPIASSQQDRPNYQAVASSEQIAYFRHQPQQHQQHRHRQQMRDEPQTSSRTLLSQPVTVINVARRHRKQHLNAEQQQQTRSMQRALSPASQNWSGSDSSSCSSPLQLSPSNLRRSPIHLQQSVALPISPQHQIQQQLGAQQPSTLVSPTPDSVQNQLQASSFSTSPTSPRRRMLPQISNANQQMEEQSKIGRRRLPQIPVARPGEAEVGSSKLSLCRSAQSSSSTSSHSAELSAMQQQPTRQQTWSYESQQLTTNSQQQATRSFQSLGGQQQQIRSPAQMVFASPTSMRSTFQAQARAKFSSSSSSSSTQSPLAPLNSLSPGYLTAARSNQTGSTSAQFNFEQQQPAQVQMQMQRPSELESSSRCAGGTLAGSANYSSMMQQQQAVKSVSPSRQSFQQQQYLQINPMEQSFASCSASMGELDGGCGSGSGASGVQLTPLALGGSVGGGSGSRGRRLSSCGSGLRANFLMNKQQAISEFTPPKLSLESSNSMGSSEGQTTASNAVTNQARTMMGQMCPANVTSDLQSGCQPPSYDLAARRASRTLGYPTTAFLSGLPPRAASATEPGCDLDSLPPNHQSTSTWLQPSAHSVIVVQSPHFQASGGATDSFFTARGGNKTNVAHLTGRLPTPGFQGTRLAPPLGISSARSIDVYPNCYDSLEQDEKLPCQQQQHHHHQQQLVMQQPQILHQAQRSLDSQHTTQATIRPQLRQLASASYLPTSSSATTSPAKQQPPTSVRQLPTPTGGANRKYGHWIERIEAARSKQTADGRRARSATQLLAGTRRKLSSDSQEAKSSSLSSSSSSSDDEDASLSSSLDELPPRNQQKQQHREQQLDVLSHEPSWLQADRPRQPLSASTPASQAGSLDHADQLTLAERLRLAERSANELFRKVDLSPKGRLPVGDDQRRSTGSLVGGSSGTRALPATTTTHRRKLDVDSDLSTSNSSSADGGENNGATRLTEVQDKDEEELDDLSLFLRSFDKQIRQTSAAGDAPGSSPGNKGASNYDTSNEEFGSNFRGPPVPLGSEKPRQIQAERNRDDHLQKLARLSKSPVFRAKSALGLLVASAKQHSQRSRSSNEAEPPCFPSNSQMESVPQPARLTGSGNNASFSSPSKQRRSILSLASRRAASTMTTSSSSWQTANKCHQFEENRADDELGKADAMASNSQRRTGGGLWTNMQTLARQRSLVELEHKQQLKLSSEQSGSSNQRDSRRLIRLPLGAVRWFRRSKTSNSSNSSSSATFDFDSGEQQQLLLQQASPNLVANLSPPNKQQANGSSR